MSFLSTWGTVEPVPLDSETFGFQVGEWRRGDLHTILGAEEAWRAAFTRLTEDRHVELVSCVVGATELAWLDVLPRLGFRLTDYSLRATLTRLGAAKLPPERMKARLAQVEDWDAVERIAGSVFQFGRYHTDVRLPRELADRRYADWIRRARAAGDPVYVVGPVGAPAGFFHVAVRDDTAELRLGAADPQAGGLAGYGIYVGTMHALQRTGLRSATTKVSAANTAVLNLYVALGFTFSEPQVTFHWHAPNHLPRG